MKLMSEDIFIKAGYFQFLRSAACKKNGHPLRKQAYLKTDGICFKMEAKTFHEVTVLNPVH